MGGGPPSQKLAIKCRYAAADHVRSAFGFDARSDPHVSWPADPTGRCRGIRGPAAGTRVPVHILLIVTEN